MTWFIVKWTAVAFAIWFLNGLRKVWKNPRFKIIEYDNYDTGLRRYSEKVNAIRLTVKRQEFIPPFRLLEETWIRLDYEDIWKRVPDGRQLNGECGLYSMYILMIAEEKHLEKTMEIK